MSSEKFTQGEWRVDEYTNAIYVLENGQYKTVANTNCTNWDGDVWGANAALIAAAPEMYEFIGWLASVEGQCAILTKDPEIVRKAQAVLNKARGEE